MSEKAERQWVTLVPGQVHIIYGKEQVRKGDIIQATLDYDRECLTFLDQSDAPYVHIIDDLRGVRNIPPLSSIYNMRFLRHRRLGCYVTLGVLSHPVLRFVSTRVGSLVKLRYRDASSLKDAYRFLIEKDPSLPALETWSIPPALREA